MIEKTLPTPRILVIDDDPVSVRVLHELLKSQYRVSWAAEGSDGLTLAQDTLPDLILMDILMPGLNGLEVCRRLREDSLTRGIPVIFLTTQAEAKDQELGDRVGGNDYLVKPFDLKELLARVNTQIRNRAGRCSHE
jgi:putative two-component system response regulator